MLTGVALVVELAARWREGGWLVFVAVAALVLPFEAVHRTYRGIGAAAPST
ncbi:hypothetical protein [Nonomuraea pusilla]|uniref:Uncharacterized protein n=1 Tax=Nonomuraea pusilla TaxID=46177 RepID=A0A1H7QNB4_9ACTN|nr:hypothetical protein [Nonomuraea pusilla]SEL49105.1 hypothetical protein SAMN05660976_02611 [Nonomuraea pusilla]